jgi:hypothetical protein
MMASANKEAEITSNLCSLQNFQQLQQVIIGSLLYHPHHNSSEEGWLAHAIQKCMG